MELPIQQCRSSLKGCVDPRLTVGTARRVTRVYNTDDRQTVAAGQHWTGKPLKHRLSSLLSYLHLTTIKCYSIRPWYLQIILPHTPPQHIRHLNHGTKRWVPPYQYCLRNNKHRRTQKFFFVKNPPQMSRNSISSIHHIKLTILHTMIHSPSKRQQELIGQIPINIHTLFLTVQIFPVLLTRLDAKLSIQSWGILHLHAFFYDA